MSKRKPPSITRPLSQLNKATLQALAERSNLSDNARLCAKLYGTPCKALLEDGSRCQAQLEPAYAETHSFCFECERKLNEKYQSQHRERQRTYDRNYTKTHLNPPLKAQLEAKRKFDVFRNPKKQKPGNS